MVLKADKQDLIDLENRLLDKLKEVMAILGQFANKDDINRRIAQLTKNIRDIMNLLQSQEASRRKEDDAMFSKR